MSIKKKIATSYTIEDHPNKEAVFQWIRDNWHDLGGGCVREMQQTLKAFGDYHGVRLDYAISIVPDRGEYVRIPVSVDFTDKPEGDCPLTGICYDRLLLDATDRHDAEYKVLKALHEEGEYLYSNDGLLELCEANGYYFLESGEYEG